MVRHGVRDEFFRKEALNLFTYLFTRSTQGHCINCIRRRRKPTIAAEVTVENHNRIPVGGAQLIAGDRRRSVSVSVL